MEPQCLVTVLDTPQGRIMQMDWKGRSAVRPLPEGETPRTDCGHRLLQEMWWEIFTQDDPSV